MPRSLALWARIDRSTVEALICVAVALVCAATPAPAHAQDPVEPDDLWHTQSWMGDVAFASANSLLAGITAGVLQELRGGSFRDGFTRGALGGAVAYGGRRIVAEDFWGAGLLGRQVAAIGISVARNAADNRPSLQLVRIPVGPAIIEVDRTDDVVISARADLFAIGSLVTAIADDRLNFDAETSLSSGAPVFRAHAHRIRHDDEIYTGVAVGGVVVVGRPSDQLSLEDTFAHERVHVLQYDFAQLLWGDPLEEFLGKHIPFAAGAQRYVRFGVLMPLLTEGVGRVTGIGGADTFWELEAYYLDGR